MSALTFSPDGRTLVAGGNLDTASGLRIIDIARGTVQTPNPAVPFALGLTYRTDGRVLIVTGVGRAAAYPVTARGVGTGKALTAMGTSAETALFSPDGELLAVGSPSGKVQFYDACTLAPQGGPVVVSSTIVASLAFSADSRQLAAEDEQLKFRLVDVPGRAPVGDSFAGGPGFGYAGLPRADALALPGPTVSAHSGSARPAWRRRPRAPSRVGTSPRPSGTATSAPPATTARPARLIAYVGTVSGLRHS